MLGMNTKTNKNVNTIGNPCSTIVRKVACWFGLNTNRIKGSIIKIYDKYTNKRCDLVDSPLENESVEYPINKCVIPIINATIPTQIIWDIFNAINDSGVGLVGCAYFSQITENGNSIHAIKHNAAQKKHI